MTSDSGLRWWVASLGQALVAATSVRGVLFALAVGSNSVGVTASHGPPPPIWLYRSSDHGRTWHYLSTVPGVLGWEADLVTFTPSVSFALVKSVRNDDPRWAGIRETTDGGRRWIKRSDPCSRPFSRVAVDWTERLAGTSPRSLWLVCGGEPRGDSQAKVVLRSSNDARSWIPVASDLPGEHAPPHDISLAGVLPDPGTTGYFSVASRRDAWLILLGDTHNTIVRTGDGGHTWFRAPRAVEMQSPKQVDLIAHSVVVLTGRAIWVARNGRWGHLISQRLDKAKSAQVVAAQRLVAGIGAQRDRSCRED